MITYCAIVLDSSLNVRPKLYLESSPELLEQSLRLDVDELANSEGKSIDEYFSSINNPYWIEYYEKEISTSNEIVSRDDIVSDLSHDISNKLSDDDIEYIDSLMYHSYISSELYQVDLKEYVELILSKTKDDAK